MPSRGGAVVAARHAASAARHCQRDGHQQPGRGRRGRWGLRSPGDDGGGAAPQLGSHTHSAFSPAWGGGALQPTPAVDWAHSGRCRQQHRRPAMAYVQNAGGPCKTRDPWALRRQKLVGGLCPRQQAPRNPSQAGMLRFQRQVITFCQHFKPMCGTTERRQV